MHSLPRRSSELLISQISTKNRVTLYLPQCIVGAILDHAFDLGRRL